jgi:hypothetical protein
MIGQHGCSSLLHHNNFDANKNHRRMPSTMIMMTSFPKRENAGSPKGHFYISHSEFVHKMISLGMRPPRPGFRKESM